MVSSSGFAAPAFVPALVKTRVWGFGLNSSPSDSGWAAVSSTSRWGYLPGYDRIASDRLDQRYFSSALGGRFLSSDPYEASGGAGDPGSWNRYPYVGGDPVNHNDKDGLAKCRVAGASDGFARINCVSDDGTVSDWQWMVAPNPPPLPLDESGPWASAVTDFAAATWGAGLDRMAEGRNRTTQTYRAASRGAIGGLAPQCQALFSLTTILDSSGTQNSVLSLLSEVVDSVSFYNINGAEADLTYNQASGIDVTGNPTVGSAIGSYDAVTLAMVPDGGVPLYLRHIVLGNGFLNAAAAAQNALLVHELLHVVLGSHERIFQLFNVTSAFVSANGGDPSVALTNFIQGGCPRP